MMLSALDRAMANVASMDFTPPLYGYDAPVSPSTIAGWQRELDREYPRGPHYQRLLVRWEPGDPWQPVRRFFLWLGQDPSYVKTEPWILRELRGPSPRSKDGSHYCGDGYCSCEIKRYRWVGGACKHIDTMTWRIYQETGLYATRWWVIQGSHGGHRYRWDRTEPACVISQMKGGDGQPPVAGNLPYAPFDARTVRAIRAEHVATRAANRLKDIHRRKDALQAEEKADAEVIAKALWDWTGQQAEDLWNEGGELLPRFFEEKYGRAPVGHKVTTDYEAIEERALTPVL